GLNRKGHRMPRQAALLTFAFILAFLAGPPSNSAGTRDLTFAQRVEVQRTIERVYYRHLLGASRPFEAAVPDAVLEKKVSIYLAQSGALERAWHAPVTAGLLSQEMRRISPSTRLPDRLRELYAALGQDSWLIQECLVRPVLVSRLVRERFVSDGGPPPKG